jgi:Domain of unknown function (DUF1844)
LQAPALSTELTAGGEHSMPEEKNDSAGFKVVDRRPFSEDGSVRAEVREESKDAEPAPKPPPATAAPAAAEPVEFSDEDLGGFEGVVQFLGTTAMFQLGLMQAPGGERIPADPVSARHTINMLEVLQRKTRGNLTLDETKLLGDILYELRMTFVELEKRQSKKGK